MTVKLLLVSDLHGSGRALSWIRECIAEHNPDVVLIAGDLTHFGPPGFVDEIATLLGRILAVNGNCDTAAVVNRMHALGISAIDRLVALGDAIIVGIGWPVGDSALRRIPQSLREKVMSHALSPLPKIVLSHSPALGYLDEPSAGHHIGSRALLEFIRVLEPELVLTGHVHEAPGIIEGRTVIVNPGPAKEMRACSAEVEKGGARVQPL
ncbi:MAG: metallophosphoesterase [Candidatus Thermoplasmatota archaeon]